MEQRVVGVLEKNFPDSELKFLSEADSHKVSGVLLWEGFTKHGFPWRQNRLYRVLRRELGPEATLISHIFAYTPNEYEQMMSVE